MIFFFVAFLLTTSVRGLRYWWLKPATSKHQSSDVLRWTALKWGLREMFYLFIKKTTIYTMDITIAAILQYCHTSNPGLLEQEPGQGLIVLLYDSFYAG